MQTLLGIVIVLLLVVLVLIGFALREFKRMKELQHNDRSSELLNQNIQSMHQRLDTATNILHQRLDASHKQMLHTFDSFSKTMGSVGEELGNVKQIGQNLSKFQAFLNSPKLRGNLGETILYDSLSKILPKESFNTQHTFASGAIVDALIVTDKGHIPVDSKFPMDDFKVLMQAEGDDEARARSSFVRSSKKHIDDISKKYINTGEGTLDFALMYVPSEQVYYEMVSGDHDVLEYARTKKVLLVSPNTFFHFLRVVLMGLERAKMAEEAEKVWQLLTGLQHDFKKFGTKIDVLAKHIHHAQSAVDTVGSDYQKIGVKFDNIKLLD